MDKKRIMIFEDDQFTAEFNTFLFEDQGYEVKNHESVEDLLEKVQAYNPSVILMDLRIPDIGGAEATKLIKSNDQTRHIPVVLYSADIKVEQIAKETSADAYVKKPFDINEISALLERF